METKGYNDAITIFSRMFANPLFDKSLMDKEISAVNSENEKNLNSDSWRQMEVIKRLGNEKHPNNQFSTGNKETLGSVSSDELHSRLLEFYNKYYIPTSMKLAVLSIYIYNFFIKGNQSLDELQDLITSNFSDIRRNKHDVPSTYGKLNRDTKPYLPENLVNIDNLLIF